MPRVSKVCLAILFAALQVAALFHGAEFGFASHSHARTAFVAFDTPVLAVFGEPAPSTQEDQDQGRPCDVAVFCDKLTKLVGSAVPVDAEGDTRVQSVNLGDVRLTAHPAERARARAPPFSLLT
ncbi:MAG: hypothetical protein RLO08_12040 [Parvibaculaceae bacterium]